ncbi:recombinase family protein [Mycobacterium sp. 1423905.2]|uniref:recombinase family protein n=1 Tax=Mycobacterium sp. 1423905.2 TaxID=1856859 RepID=UPI0007FD8667|nr:recombinase family protein [Mycobacterium sp. 1423905.2]OBJ49535.1 serine recombinase [Mycobacterium sp. 1423905.2]
MRAAIYTRISDDQTGRGLGVARQLEDCQALADKQGWNVTTTYDDNDISAYSGKTRPGFEAMLKAMAAGQFDALLCWHTDRLYRNMRDLERVIELADAKRIEIRTVQGGTLDLSTSAGRMVARILGSVARQESEHSSERRKRANVQRAASGQWVVARRPLGYTMDGTPLEPEASAIRQAITDVLAGKSVRAVAREWNECGPRTTGSATTWRSPMVRRVLMNPRYAALVVHQGKIVGPGKWKALIDEDTHHGIVAYLSDPTRINYVGFERKYQGSGVYRCGVCGAALVHFVPAGARPRAYSCTQRHVRRQGEALDKYIDAIVVEWLSRTDIEKLIEPADVDVARLHAQRTALRVRMDELASLFAEGSITAPQLKRGTTQLANNIDALESELAAATRGNPVSTLVDGSQSGFGLEKRWAVTAPDIRGKVIDQLLTVTVNRSPRGLRRFDPNYVDIGWKV